MKDNDLKSQLSEEFAVEIINLANYLQNQRCNSALITQVLKSGTSIGANIAESLYAESTIDYIHKLKISLKEASETRYWLKILLRANYLDRTYYDNLNGKCISLIKILASIIKSVQK